MRIHWLACLTPLLLAAPTLAADELAKVSVNKEKKEVSVPAKIAPRKLANLPDIYPLEVIATYPAPKGQKAHETVVVFDVSPSDVHKALTELGLEPGAPAKGEGAKAAGPEVEIFLEIPREGAAAERIAIEKLIVDRKTGKQMPKLKWHFTGSVMKQLDPDKPEKVYGADATGTLIAIFPVTDETVIQTNLTMREEKLIKLDVNKKLLPAEGTPVALVIVAK